MRSALAWLAVLLVAGVGIPVLAEATMSRRTPVDPDSAMEVVLRVRISHEPENSAIEMARTLFAGCRLQVPATVDETGFKRLGSDRFRFVITPGLNQSDRRQLHGCLEDARLQHVQANVLHMREIR